ncbi:MAG: Hpt domain-containing protein [Hahellaceae bacterium]|nr:Hpt domain-containing protein [Hahellaceae bacterium]
MDKSEHLNLSAIAELREVMEEDFNFLIETFLQDSEERITQLKAAFAAADAVEFGRAGHSFKGSCTNIGLPRLAEMCLVAEKTGKHGDLSRAAEMIENIEAEFHIASQLLEQEIASD